MSGADGERFVALERQMIVIHDLLATDEVDAGRIDAGLQELSTLLAAMPAASVSAEADLVALVHRCRDLHAVILVRAQAHRERLAAALIQLDRSAVALRSYGHTPSEVSQFVDRSG